MDDIKKELLRAALVIGVFIITGLVFWRRHRAMRLAKAASAIGLEPTGKELYRATIGHSLVVVHVQRNMLGATTSLRVSGELPTDISIGKDGILSDVRTGDAAFDQVVQLEGNEAVVLALFDEALQPAIKEAVEAGWTLLRGTWSLYRPGRPSGELEDLVLFGTLLADRLRAAYAALPARLAARARGEPTPERRRVFLEHLERKLWGQPVQRDAFAAALTDESPEIRLYAAATMGVVDTLVDLARDTSLAGELRAQALGYINARIAKRTIERAQIETALAPLIETRELEAPLALELAKALGLYPHPQGEEPLIALVGYPDDAVQRAAIASLGERGTAACVPALLAQRKAFELGTGNGARDALQKVRARLGPQNAGGLAVAEADGALAVVEEP